MSKTSALRYLLLRYLNDHIQSGRCDADLGQEASRTLDIESGDGHYFVSWTRRGVKCLHQINMDEVEFYIRGDVPQRRTPQNLNEQSANAFVVAVCGVAAPPTDHPMKRRFSLGRGNIALLVGLAGMAILAGSDAPWLLLVLAASLFLENFSPSSRLVAIAVLVLGLIHPAPMTVAAAAFAFGLFAVLDPDPRLRKMRVGLSFAIASYSFVAGPPVDWVLLGPLLVGALGLAVAHSMVGVHHRAHQLVFVMSSVGLIGDGFVAAGAFGLAASLAGFALRLYSSDHTDGGLSFDA